MKSYKEFITENIYTEDYLESRGLIFNKETKRWDITRSININGLSISTGEYNFLLEDGKIKYPLGEIKGNFELGNDYIKSDENFPERVNGDFSIIGGKIKDIKNWPDYIHGNCHLQAMNLKTLKGFENTKLIGDLILTMVDIENLEGVPDLSNNTLIFTLGRRIKSFEGIQSSILHVDRSHIHINETEVKHAEQYDSGINYWESLFKYAKEHGYFNRFDHIAPINWPKEFIDDLEGNDKNLLSSRKTISKFNL